MNQLLSILNPIRIVSCDDWMKAAEIIHKLDNRSEEMIITRSDAFKLLSRFETLCKQPLRKEIFVNEVKKPRAFDNWAAGGGYYQSDIQECKDYQSAQEKVLFEGFNANGTKDNILIHFYGEKKEFFEVIEYEFKEEIIKLTNPTIFDFIIEIDRYNRTASNKISINWTERIVKELVK